MIRCTRAKILGTIPLFREYELTASNVKHKESIGHGHIVCLFNFLSTSTNGNGLSIAFDLDRARKADHFS